VRRAFFFLSARVILLGAILVYNNGREIPLKGDTQMTPRLTLACGFLFCSGFFAQTPSATPSPATPPKFDTATIRRNVSGGDDSFDAANGALKVINRPLADVFRFAFQIGDENAWRGVPYWLLTEHYDVIAQGSATTDEELRLMTQSLLTSQLKLVTHSVPRTLNAYVLTVGKDGPNLQPSTSRGKASCDPVGPQGIRAGGQHRQCKNMRMPDLVVALSEMANQYFDKPILNQTGLWGTYDFRLDWVGLQNVAALGGQTIYEAVEKIGLKLEEKAVSGPILAIDHVEKPAQN
jgi:uncharacterized protein (TIGR03435 family)